MLTGKKYFSVKFKGQVYHDAWTSEVDGHIWFGSNLYEYVPDSKLRPGYVRVHGYEQGTQENGRSSWLRRTKESTAKLHIMT